MLNIPKLPCLALFVLPMATIAADNAQPPAAGNPPIVSFVTVGGETIDNARLTRVEPDGLSVMIPTGIVKIPVEQLPDDLRTRFRMTSESADRYRKRNAELFAKAVGDETGKKARESYTWHAAKCAVAGRLLCVKDGWVVVGEGNWPVYGNAKLIRFVDLPTAEQQRATWIMERLLPEEIRTGEEYLKMLLWKREH